MPTSFLPDRSIKRLGRVVGPAGMFDRPYNYTQHRAKIIGMPYIPAR